MSRLTFTTPSLLLRGCALLRVRCRPLATSARRPASEGGASSSVAPIQRHGLRERLGYGYNGEQNYMDRADFPIPAVRFKELDNRIRKLREKEKGDWRKLSASEVQELYRATFCQSFAEMTAPTGEWKMVAGAALVAVSVAIWIYLWMKLYVYDPLPETITDPARTEAQVQRMVDLAVNPVEGLASKWDYQKKEWKN